jgi:hypothetical protein
MRDKDTPVIASVMLGEENGLDSFDMRQYLKDVVGDEETQKGIDGYMIYGTDVLELP